MDNRTDTHSKNRIPSARKDGLVVRNVDDEVLVYDTKRHKAHCLNTTAALVWRLCDGKSNPDVIAEKMERELNQTVSTDIVNLALSDLAAAHLLLETTTPGKSGVTRRQIMRALAIGVAIAIPAVTTIVTPTASHAGTCVDSGGSCTSSSECCSGLCAGITCA
jgi:hypothetical protein